MSRLLLLVLFLCACAETPTDTRQSDGDALTNNGGSTITRYDPSDPALLTSGSLESDEWTMDFTARAFRNNQSIVCYASVPVTIEATTATEFHAFVNDKRPPAIACTENTKLIPPRDMKTRFANGTIDPTGLITFDLYVDNLPPCAVRGGTLGILVVLAFDCSTAPLALFR